jgi:CrcB protein
VSVGFCGSGTSFSSFSLQTLALARDGEWRQVGGNLLSVALCLAVVWLGHTAAAGLNRFEGA